MPSLEAAFESWGEERVSRRASQHSEGPGSCSPLGPLVIDNSICNTNQNCTVPEQFPLPSLRDIQAKRPTLPEKTRSLCQVSAWISRRSHKTSLVRESDRGLSGLRQQDRLFFYKVCPFGATFSSHWFSRCWHLLIWLPHILMLYACTLVHLTNLEANKCHLRWAEATWASLVWTAKQMKASTAPLCNKACWPRVACAHRLQSVKQAVQGTLPSAVRRSCPFHHVAPQQKDGLTHGCIGLPSC